MDYQVLIEMAVLAGEIMLVSGAEVYRIEDTVSRILKQSGLEGIEVFALATGIFATLSDPSISAITVVKRVNKRSTNLNRVYRVNNISRRFCAGEMTVEEALKFFENVPSISRKIATLYDVGLSYIRLGQPSTELSGGEAQRIKLATELSKRGTGKTIYLRDEPTTGLHFADVHKLIEILRKLSEGGNTVVVIEHNLDVIKTADYIIDIGPEGGDKGGTVIAQGTPEEVAANPVSYTGQYVKKYLE